VLLHYLVKCTATVRKLEPLHDVHGEYLEIVISQCNLCFVCIHLAQIFFTAEVTAVRIKSRIIARRFGGQKVTGGRASKLVTCTNLKNLGKPVILGKLSVNSVQPQGKIGMDKIHGVS